jgi:hypothetical protein
MVPARMLSTAFRRHGCTPTVMTTPTMHLGRHSPSRILNSSSTDSATTTHLTPCTKAKAVPQHGSRAKVSNRVDQRRRLVAGRSRLTLVLRGRTRTGLMPEAVESRGS